MELIPDKDDHFHMEDIERRIKELQKEHGLFIPRIVELLDPENITKGINGSKFRIKLDDPTFSYGDVITYDKYHGAEMYVTIDPIIDTGDGFVYTVQLVNNPDHKFIDNKYIQDGTWIMRKGPLATGPDSYSKREPIVIKQAI